MVLPLNNKPKKPLPPKYTGQVKPAGPGAQVGNINQSSTNVMTAGATSQPNRYVKSGNLERSAVPSTPSQGVATPDPSQPKPTYQPQTGGNMTPQGAPAPAGQTAPVTTTQPATPTGPNPARANELKNAQAFIAKYGKNPKYAGQIKWAQARIDSINRGEQLADWEKVRKSGVLPTQQPAQPTQPQTPATPQPAPAQEPAQPAPADPQFKAIEDFFAKDMKEDPMYQQEMRLGEDKIKKYMAARGLNASGADVTAFQNLANQAASNQVGRNLQVAGQNAQMFNDYVQNLTQNKMDLSNDEWNRRMDILRLMADQSPMAAAFQATQGISNSLDAQGNNVGNAMTGQYFNQPAGSGGANNNSGYIPPFSTTGIDSGYAGLGNAQNINFMNLLSGMLGGLMGGKTQQ